MVMIIRCTRCIPLLLMGPHLRKGYTLFTENCCTSPSLATFFWKYNFKWTIQIIQISFFFNLYFAASQPTLGQFWGGSFTHPMLIIVFLYTQPICHQGPCNMVRSLSLVEHQVGFEPETFQFWLQLLNPCNNIIDTDLKKDPSNNPHTIAYK